MAKLKISPPPFPNRKEYPFTASVRYRGMTIDIENLDGSVREGKDANGNFWRTPFNGCHYGELRGSLGTDGDKLDVYIKSRPVDGANKAYIVHQNHPRTHPTKGGRYDEDKVILGVASVEAAKKLYLQHYQRKDFLRSVTEMPIEKFKRYAFGENKGEKVARYITKSELRAYGTDPEKIKRAAKNLVGKNGRPASAFIRMKMGNLERKQMQKTALDEAYEAGVQHAIDEYVKAAATTTINLLPPTLKKPKGFMTVTQKPLGSPPTKGRLPKPPKVGKA